MNHHKAKAIAKQNGLELIRYKYTGGQYWHLTHPATTEGETLGYSLEFETPESIQASCETLLTRIKEHN